jgi:hypothetical protein
MGILYSLHYSSGKISMPFYHLQAHNEFKGAKNLGFQILKYSDYDIAFCKVS